MSKEITPGEWKQSHRICDDEGNYATQVFSETGETICTLSWYAKPKDENGAIGTYREANAKLIAAAPDLLAACFNAIGVCDLENEAHKYVFEQLTAAFNKAKIN